MNPLNPRGVLPQMYGFGLTVDNVNEALPLGLQLIKDHGVPFASRGLDTLEVPGPVSTVYRTPMRRVLFDEVRDANPFFHLMESLWILGGGKTVHLPKMFLSTIDQFSDDGVTFHGAYGDRLRAWPTLELGNPHRIGDEKEYVIDQVSQVIQMLRSKPDTRQAVMSIWNPADDLGTMTKDMPCNDMIMFSARDGFLHMTVCNRSNDVIWGAYGANAVQFSMLQEVIAVACGLEVGYYVQQSNSYHVYTSNPFWQAYLRDDYDFGHVHNPYMNNEVQPWPVAERADEALNVIADCTRLVWSVDTFHGHGNPLTLMQLGGTKFDSPFFNSVVVPMIGGYALYKDGKYVEAMHTLNDMAAPDWRAACVAWVLRRKERADARKEAAK